MSSEDLDKTVLVGPDATPDGSDADPDATVLAEPPAHFYRSAALYCSNVEQVV